MAQYKKINEYFFLGNAKHNQIAMPEKENKYDSENYNFNIDNKNDSHSLIVNRVKEKSTILDVGCATGLIGEKLKEYKNAIVDGIEYDNVSYKIAKEKQVYRHVYNMSITDITSNEYKKFIKNKDKYDYIIFADILEHLNNPWEIIYNLSTKLNNNGKIIISVPNVNHIDIIKGLIDGDFNYNDLGILDSTHIRFFTNNSFFEMMENFNERYDVKFHVDNYARTTYCPNFLNQKSLLNKKEYMIVQNLFELTKAKQDETIKYINKIKKGYNFAKILEIIENYEDLLKEKEHLENDITSLKDKISSYENIVSEYAKTVENLNLQINNIVNSRRYKLANFFAKLKK